MSTTGQWPLRRTCRNSSLPRWPRRWTAGRNRKRGVYGPALGDSTRLALSSFDIWGDIFDTNRRQIVVALDSYLAKLEEFRQDLDNGAMRRHFDAAAHLAAQVRDGT